MNSPVTPSATADFKRAVALQFASRPTFRQVAAQKVLQYFVELHVNLGTVHPPLNDAEPLVLLIPTSKYSGTPVSLMDRVMQALLEGKPLSLEKINGGLYGLTFPEPYRYKGSDGHEYTELQDTTQAFHELLQALPYHFQQAQLEYWQGPSSFAVSRDRWLQQTLKSALLQNLPLHDLDTQQQACVYGLLKGGQQSPNVFFVEVQLEAEGQTYTHMLPNLLLHGEWDERTLVLWCSPSSVVKGFESFDAFAQALSREMAEHYHFESMSWNRYELEGDAFAQQSALLLERMLESVQQVRHAQVSDIEAMARLYAALSDPSQWFIEGYTRVSPTSVSLPPGLQKASAADSFAYQCALFELALAQAEFNEAQAPAEVLDLHSFTRQRLRAQLLTDYPVEANYFPDDLILTFIYTEANPGGAGTGVGGGVIETQRMTLTEFAIANLSSLNGRVLQAIEHRTGQLIMDWMNPEYVKALIAKVDIGGHYPAYVANLLDDPLTREQRATNFARQWRCSLLFSAVQAKLAGTLSEGGLQCLVDFYHGQADQQAPAVMLMPLAFEREPSASHADVVSGMYVFFPDDAARVLLYRPLYADNALMEFTSIDALMAAIAQAGPLQDSILQWLPAEARAVYDHGGFDEPHLGRPIIDTSILPEPVKPASLEMQFWKIDVDSKLYKANRDLLVELADRQSVSNAESRWALLRQGAWLLFNVVALSLRGPVATVAWLVQTIEGLKGDVVAQESGSESEKTTALIDVILNVVMTLLHVRLPQVEPPPVSRLPGAEGFSGTAPQGLGSKITDLVPEQGKQGLAGSLAAHNGALLDFSWHQGSGVYRLPEQQRKALFSLRADVDLDGLKVLESGDSRNLYLVGDSHYATLDGANYRVEVSAQGVRVVGSEGTLGPWLLREGRQWRIDAGLRLLGGGPKRRMELVKKENLKEFDELNAKQEAIAAESVEVTKEFNESEEVLNKKILDLQRLKETVEKIDLSKPDGMKLRNAFNQRITMTERGIFFSKSLTIENLKKVIEVNLKRDRALADMVKPNLAKHKLMADIKKQRSTFRYRLISDIGSYYNRIVTLIDYIKDSAQINDMNFEPVDIQNIGNYFFVLSLVEKIVAMRDELVWVSKHLDWLLVDTMNDLDIVFARDPGEEQQSKSSKVESLIRQRNLTGNDIQLNMLQELAYLSVDRGLEVDFEIMRQHHEKLWSAELNSAGTAHGALATVDVSLADEINILNDALKEYRVFQGYATYLSEAGGVVIKTAALQRYQQTLETLITSAESALAQAIRESESIDAALPKPKLYRRREGKHHVVKTKTGRRVIAEETKVDGVLVVQQKSADGDKVLITFNRQGEQWVEQVEEPTSEPQPVANANDIGAARASARTAIGQVESVLKLANQYIASNQPIGMQSVIEGHVERLKAVGKALDSTGIAGEFGTQLTDAIKRLSDSESELLTRYHLTTRHPTAASLRFLFNTQKISIKRTTTRKALAANDFLDIYEIRSVPSRGNEQGRAIWEAHFHYKDSATPARQFAKGHLKTWSQRLIGRKVQLEAASSSGELVAVYRGNLVLSDVDGIIPFA